MLAARDQENFVHTHQQVAAGKPLNQVTRALQPKTPGHKFPKTPLKVPLNDENAPMGFRDKGGKGKDSELLVTAGKKGLTSNKTDFLTPMGPQTRAPLGAKTTNAKTKAFQTPSGPIREKDHEKTQAKQTSIRKPQRVIHASTVKLDVYGAESPLADREVEYCPPKCQELPYESNEFPNNCMDYSHLKPENLVVDLHNRYRRTLNNSSMSISQRISEEAYQKDIEVVDESIAAMMQEEWTIGDVPETFRHLRKRQQTDAKPESLESSMRPARTFQNGPPTVVSRKAASILSTTPEFRKPLYLPTKHNQKTSLMCRPKPLPSRVVPGNSSTTMRHNAATATSRSTIGYSKGRAVPTILHRSERKGLTRSVSNTSQDSDATITPVNFATEQEWRNPGFMKAFEVDEEELEAGLRGFLPPCLTAVEEDDDEFVMSLEGAD